MDNSAFKQGNPGSKSAAPQAGAGKNSPQPLPVQVQLAGAGEDTRGQIMLDITRMCLDVLKQQNITEPRRISATIVNNVADEL